MSTWIDELEKVMASLSTRVEQVPIVASASASASASRTGNLSWGQLQMWRNIETLSPNDAHLNLTNSFDLALTPVDEIVARCAALIEAAESLRTTYVSNGLNEPRQLVGGNTKQAVLVVDVDESEERAVETAATDFFSSRRFDVTTDYALRLVLIASDSKIRRAIVCVSHLAADAYSVDLVVQSLSEYESPALAMIVESRDPIDQSDYERSDAAQRHIARATAYWCRFYDELDHEAFPLERHEPDSPRYWHGELRSWSVLVAAREFAKAVKVSSASVMLAACALEFASLSDATVVPMWLRFSNRTSYDVRFSIMNLSQNTPVLIPIDETLDASEFVRSVHQAATRSYRYAWMNPIISSQIAIDRGKEPRIPTYNYIEMGDDLGADGNSDGDGTFEWIEKFDGERITAFVNIWSGVSLLADTAAIPPEQIREFAEGVRSRLMEFAEHR